MRQYEWMGQEEAWCVWGAVFLMVTWVACELVPAMLVAWQV